MYQESSPDLELAVPPAEYSSVPAVFPVSQALQSAVSAADSVELPVLGLSAVSEAVQVLLESAASRHEMLPVFEAESLALLELLSSCLSSSLSDALLYCSGLMLSV